MPIQPTPPAPPPLWPWVFAWLLLVVHFATPPREVFDHTLDLSNYATYSYFLTHGMQWGPDVIPMTGPYGFLLYGHTYSGELYWTRFFGDLALKGVFAALLLHLFQRAGRSGWRWAWMTVVVLMVPRVDDLFHDFAILLSTLVLLANYQRRLNVWSVLALLQLGSLALFKGTHFAITSASFASVLLYSALHREWRTAGMLTAAFAASVMLFWCLSGQNPLNFPYYAVAMFDLAAGYSQVMGIDEMPVIRDAGLLLAAILALTFACTAWAMDRRSAKAVIAVLVLAGFTFVKWKHGFLRADGHVFIFFTSASVVATTLALVAFSPLFNNGTVTAFAPLKRRLALALFTAAVGVSIFGSAEFQPSWIRGIVTDIPPNLARNVRYLTRPDNHRAKLEKELELTRREMHLPQIQNEVRNATVDFFGYEEGVLLLNDLNYRPRPMGGGSFNVFTPWLQRRNEAYIKNPRTAPAWQVVKLQTLDDRLPTADDPLALRAVLEGYTPVLMQRDYLLMKRRQEPVFTVAREIETRSVRPGDKIALPEVAADQLLLFTIETPLTFAGKIRSTLYRPPNLLLRVVAERFPWGREFVLKPIMAREPVILSPFLADNGDILRLLANEPGNQVSEITLLASPGFDTENFKITFYKAPRPQPPESGDVNELRTYMQHPLYNRQPVQLSENTTGIRELNLEPVTIVHAPGSITWNLEPDDQQVIFSYGMMPQTYLDGGDTDGVEFNVEVLWRNNDGRVLFKRMMRPLTVPADRGMQRARIYLPPYEPGAQLRIRTHPGQDNSAAYDQSYVTRVQIKSGPLHPEQFNGLGAVPSNGQLPRGSVAGIGTRSVYLVHAPDEVLVDVPRGSSEFSCEIGLLPGAYEKGGHSDGVEFTATAILPDGTRKVLASRFLDPLRQARDQGPQTFMAPLANLPEGSKLAITTGVGPRGDRSWDQSYVAGLKFR